MLVVHQMPFILFHVMSMSGSVPSQSCQACCFMSSDWQVVANILSLSAAARRHIKEFNSTSCLQRSLSSISPGIVMQASRALTNLWIRESVSCTGCDHINLLTQDNICLSAVLASDMSHATTSQSPTAHQDCWHAASLEPVLQNGVSAVVCSTDMLQAEKGAVSTHAGSTPSKWILHECSSHGDTMRCAGPCSIVYAVHTTQHLQ